MTGETEKGKVGTLFEDFLRKQGTYEETTEQALKRVLEWEIWFEGEGVTDDFMNERD